MPNYNLPHHQPLPEPPEYELPQEPLGLTAVESEDARVHNLLQADRLQEDKLAIHALHAASIPEHREIRSWLDEESITDYDDADPQLDAHIRIHQGNVNILNDDRHPTLEQARRVLGEVKNPDVQRNIDAHFASEEVPKIFHSWKEAAESQLGEGRTLPWTQWLSGEGLSENSSAAATDEQLLNVLQWSVHRLVEHANDPAEQEKIKADTQRMERQLKRAVDDGLLAPALLHKVASSKVVLADIFDEVMLSSPRSVAYYNPEKNVVVVPKDGEFYAGVHERLHAKGGFATTLVNEAATQLFTKIIMDEGNEATPPHYVAEMEILNNIMETADLTSFELSSIYAGPDLQQNEKQIQDLVQEKAGADVLGYVLRYHQAQLENGAKTLFGYHIEKERLQKEEGQDPPDFSLDQIPRLANDYAIELTKRESEELLTFYKAACETQQESVDSGKVQQFMKAVIAEKTKQLTSIAPEH